MSPQIWGAQLLQTQTSIPRNNIHLKIYIQLQHLVAMQEVVCDLHSEANSVGLEMWPYL